MTTPGYFDVKVSDGKHALFDVKLDDLFEKHSVPSPQHGLKGGYGQLELCYLSPAASDRIAAHVCHPQRNEKCKNSIFQVYV